MHGNEHIALDVATWCHETCDGGIPAIPPSVAALNDPRHLFWPALLLLKRLDGDLRFVSEWLANPLLRRWPASLYQEDLEEDRAAGRESSKTYDARPAAEFSITVIRKLARRLAVAWSGDAHQYAAHLAIAWEAYHARDVRSLFNQVLQAETWRRGVLARKAFGTESPTDVDALREALRTAAASNPPRGTAGHRTRKQIAEGVAFTFGIASVRTVYRLVPHKDW